MSTWHSFAAGWCAKNDVSVGDRMSWNSFAHQGFVAKDAAEALQQQLTLEFFDVALKGSCNLVHVRAQDFGASAEEVEEARRDGVLR